MGVGSRRPPLPAPTDISSADNDNSSSAVGASDDVGTDVSRQTDRTHYSIPDDGSPVTISTKHKSDGKGPSQTSLLIEYYEAQNTGHPTSRPSLRVRVTPSASRSKRGRDHIRISETSRSGRQSNVRRIALHHQTAESELQEEDDESDASSGHPPVEVDVLHNHSSASQLDGPVRRRYIPAPSDISSMPPDILIDEPALVPAAAAAAAGVLVADKVRHKSKAADDSLKAPSRERSLSKERLVRKVAEKVQKDRHREKRKHAHGEHRSRSRSVSEEQSVEDIKSGRTRSKYREAGPEESLQPSEISGISSQSVLSTNSINNPKLLTAVEDAIKKLILPELNALKEENKTLRNRSKFEEAARESRGSPSARRDSTRRVSKTSSLPDVGRSLDVSDDRDITREDSSRRRSSRRSSHGSDRSRETAVREDSSHRRSSGEKKSTKSMATAGILGAIGGAIAATALKHHASSSSVDRDRDRDGHGRRSRTSHTSRSRTPSLADGKERASRELVSEIESGDRSSRRVKHDSRDNIPPLPMQSVLDSELTRDSILSVDTERPSDAPPTAREIQHVSRGSPRHVRPPSGSPISAKERRSRNHVDALDEPRGQPSAGTAAAVGVAAALATAAAVRHHSGGQRTPTRGVSPIQSDTSYAHDEYAEHPRIKSIRSSTSIKSDRRSRKSLSPLSSSPSPRMSSGKKRPQGLSLESPYEILPDGEFGTKTPRAEDVDEWFQHEHEHNDRLRELYDTGSNLTEIDPRSTQYTNESLADQYSDPFGAEENLHSVGAIPEYVHTPTAAVSAVASLRNPSSMSVHSSERSLRNSGGAHPDLNAANTLLVAAAAGAAGGAAAQFADSRRHWEAVRDRAMANAAEQAAENDAFESPPQSEASVDFDKPVMSANYIPVAGDMPEIMPVAMDDDELLTNPSIISGRMDGDRSYHPTPDVGHEDSHNTRDAAMLGTAVGVGLGLATAEQAASKEKQYQSTAKEYEEVPADVHQAEFASTPGHHKDEGYISAISPVRQELEPEYEEEAEDQFMTQKHLRHESGLSHGMASPLYDSATGRGLDRIQSKDIVALMDHLTVRDAHRNARDTEILVTLVRSAAEMRNNFEEIKRFIAEQDRLILNNMERGHDMTVQRVLSGPRPIPTSSSPQTPQRQPSEEDMPTKRRNMFRKALRGLTMRGSNDLGKIENMLNHLLNEVEGLKGSQSFQPSQPQTQTTSLNSYEHLRAAPDSGYEEGRANSSPTQSGYLSNNSSRHMNAMHSGYDGVRGSDSHRISTVLEGDEDLDEADRRTPTGPAKGSLQTPPDQTAQFASADPTPKTDKSKSKHKSTASSLFSGLPKVSRWSKTTASTAPESVRNSSKREYQDSPSGSNTNLGYGEYELRSSDSLGREDRSHNQRPISPPDEDEYELDDPKYHVHRNSLNLQHPQPRAGPTHLHQSHLESQAMTYENPPTPDAEQWGSTPALAHNKSRFSGSTHNRLSPVQSDDGGQRYDEYDDDDEEEELPPRPPKLVDDGPLVPPKIPVGSVDAYGMYNVPMMNSGMHIASPLEPIQEVRNSLETDRDSRHVRFLHRLMDHH
jgi:hypothetical protein